MVDESFWEQVNEIMEGQPQREAAEKAGHECEAAELEPWVDPFDILLHTEPGEEAEVKQQCDECFRRAGVPQMYVAQLCPAHQEQLRQAVERLHLQALEIDPEAGKLWLYDPTGDVACVNGDRAETFSDRMVDLVHNAINAAGGAVAWDAVDVYCVETLGYECYPDNGGAVAHVRRWLRRNRPAWMESAWEEGDADSWKRGER